MTAVTGDRISTTRALDQAIEETHAIGTTSTVYVGALVNFTTVGRVVSATAATSRRFAGEVIEILNDSGSVLAAATGNTSGTVKAKIRFNHEMLLNVKTTTRTYTNLGKTVLVSDNVTVGGTSVGTALVRVTVGQLTQFGATTATGWVRLRVYGDATATT